MEWKRQVMTRTAPCYVLSLKPDKAGGRKGKEQGGSSATVGEA